MNDFVFVSDIVDLPKEVRSYLPMKYFILVFIIGKIPVMLLFRQELSKEFFLLMGACLVGALPMIYALTFVTKEKEDEPSQCAQAAQSG